MLKQWIFRSGRLVACVSAGVMVLAVAVTARAQAPAVYDALPEKSEVVVVIPSLTALNQKLASLNTALGGVAPWMADALTEVKRSSGMNNGIDDTGGAVILLNGLTEMDAEKQPPFLLLVPVSDYKAFVANFNITDVDVTATTPVTMPQGQSAFTRQVGKYAVLGADKALVDGFTSANGGAKLLARAGKHPGQVLSRSDVLVLVDLSLLAPKLQPKLDEALKEAIEELDANPEIAKESPIDPKVALNLYAQAARKGLSSGDVAMIGLDVGELGVGLSYAAQFKPGSDVSKYFLAAKSTAAAHLKGVPNQPYLLAVSQDFTSLDIKALVDGLVGMVRQANPEVGKIVDAALPLLFNANGGASAYFPGQLNLSGSLFNSASVITTDDPAAYVKTFHDYLDTMGKSKIPFTVPAVDGGEAQKAEVTFFTQYNANTTTVDGVAIDQYELRYNLPAEVLAQINPQLMMLAGMASQRGYVAQVNGKVIVTSTPDLPTLTKAIEAAKTGKGLGEDQGINQVREQLTNGASYEAYINIGTIASTAVSFAQAMGQDLGIQVPQNMPPIGYSMSASDNGAAARTFVPMPVIVFTKDIAVMFAPMVGGMMDAQEGSMGGGPPR